MLKLVIRRIYPTIRPIWHTGDMLCVRMPGPSDYQIKGVIVLDEDVAERYWNQYECTEVTVDFDTEYADNIDKEP